MCSRQGLGPTEFEMMELDCNCVVLCSRQGLGLIEFEIMESDCNIVWDCVAGRSLLIIFYGFLSMKEEEQSGSLFVSYLKQWITLKISTT